MRLRYKHSAGPKPAGARRALARFSAGKRPLRLRPQQCMHSAVPPRLPDEACTRSIVSGETPIAASSAPVVTRCVHAVARRGICVVSTVHGAAFNPFALPSSGHRVGAGAIVVPYICGSVSSRRPALPSKVRVEPNGIKIVRRTKNVVSYRSHGVPNPPHDVAR